MRTRILGVAVVLAVAAPPAAAVDPQFVEVPNAEAIAAIDAAVAQSHELAGDRVLSEQGDADETSRYYFDSNPGTYEISGTFDNLQADFYRVYAADGTFLQDMAGPTLYPDRPWVSTVAKLTAKQSIVVGVPMSDRQIKRLRPLPGQNLDRYFVDESGFAGWKESALAQEPGVKALRAVEGTTVIWRLRDPVMGRTQLQFQDGVLTKVNRNVLTRGAQAQPVTVPGTRIPFEKASTQGRVLKRMTNQARSVRTATWRTVRARRGSGVPATWSVSTRYGKEGLQMRASNGARTVVMTPPRIFFR